MIGSGGKFEQHIGAFCGIHSLAFIEVFIGLPTETHARHGDPFLIQTPILAPNTSIEPNLFAFADSPLTRQMCFGPDGFDSIFRFDEIVEQNGITHCTPRGDVIVVAIVVVPFGDFVVHGFMVHPNAVMP